MVSEGPRRALSAGWLGLALVALVGLPSVARADDGPAGCAASALRAPADPRVAALLAGALEQHRQFGGQEIDTEGRLVRSGHGEAEFDRNAGDPEPAWRKVHRFWQAWPPGNRALRLRDSQGRAQRADLLRQAVQGASAARLDSFGGGERGLGLSARETDAVQTSLLRASLIDVPWSAVFISYLVRGAGFGDDDFRFSDAHADYARDAFAGRGAWRACDAATTPPRPGDLLCATRARAATIDTFEGLGATLGAGGSLPMHCDLVVAADAARLEARTIGGNVLQSVTLRRLALQPSAALAPRYREHAASPGASFNDLPWVLLMQLR
ncbi:DUF2272 domain-containing protein [Xylophilus sp. Kf1]|nr:DUF2272 domain-containing protein [Xylophilus sp. Kf1]